MEAFSLSQSKKITVYHCLFSEREVNSFDMIIIITITFSLVNSLDMMIIITITFWNLKMKTFIFKLSEILSQGFENELTWSRKKKVQARDIVHGRGMATMMAERRE
ncbi:hypothetical protein CFP56_012625 [Quercus suber]|uniref:Uncharacterized protein n=1 Tax=Quercus suber TaxID=58331 RepID=A0AAW0KX71_QUESU